MQEDGNYAFVAIKWVDVCSKSKAKSYKRTCVAKESALHKEKMVLGQDKAGNMKV